MARRGNVIWNNHGNVPNNDALRRLTDVGGPLCAKWCAICDQHYEWCKCETPHWKVRNEGELGPMPGEPGGPVSLMDMMDEKAKRERRNRNYDILKFPPQ